GVRGDADDCGIGGWRHWRRAGDCSSGVSRYRGGSLQALIGGADSDVGDGAGVATRERGAAGGACLALGERADDSALARPKRRARLKLELRGIDCWVTPSPVPCFPP